MLCAAIKDCPVFGGKLKSFDESKIEGRPGVRSVVKVKRHRGRRRRRYLVAGEDGARCAADRLGRGAERIRVERDDRRAPQGRAHRERRPTAIRRTVTRSSAIAGAAKKIEAVYSTPFLSHACMETMNATVRHIGRQGRGLGAEPERGGLARRAVGGIRRAARKCEVYKHDLGGGFGRRGGTQDYVRQAVAIAKEFPGVPVKLIWSREEDQAHDFFRPISQCKLSAGLDAERQPRRAARPGVRAVDQRDLESGSGSSDGKDMRQLQGFCGRSPATRSSATPCPTC